jgi:hypothetical protein
MKIHTLLLPCLLSAAPAWAAPIQCHVMVLVGETTVDTATFALPEASSAPQAIYRSLERDIEITLAAASSADVALEPGTVPVPVRLFAVDPVGAFPLRPSAAGAVTLFAADARTRELSFTSEIGPHTVYLRCEDPEAKTPFPLPPELAKALREAYAPVGCRFSRHAEDGSATETVRTNVYGRFEQDGEVREHFPVHGREFYGFPMFSGDLFLELSNTIYSSAVGAAAYSVEGVRFIHHAATIRPDPKSSPPLPGLRLSSECGLSSSGRAPVVAEKLEILPENPAEPGVQRLRVPGVEGRRPYRLQLTASAEIPGLQAALTLATGREVPLNWIVRGDDSLDVHYEALLDVTEEEAAGPLTLTVRERGEAGSPGAPYAGKFRLSYQAAFYR